VEYLLTGFFHLTIFFLLITVHDYKPFIRVWTEPDGGLRGYLEAFLKSEDKTFQHIAIWTIVQFLEGKGTASATINKVE
jgi:hypothetical protein